MSKKIKDIDTPFGVPIQRTELSIFDDSFSFLKEKFMAEMQRMDEEMNKFRLNLMTLYGQQGSSSQPGKTSGGQTTWDALANSPLIQGEGNDKMIKLNFDVSEFDPSDVRVEVVNEKIIVTAKHEQKTDNSVLLKELKREFILPHGVEANTVISSLSRDGVLTVQAPLPQLVPPTDLSKRARILSKIPEDSKKSPKSSAESKGKAPVEDELTTPAAVAGQVPQSPMSTISPASQAMPTSPISPTEMSPRKTSKASSKITKPTAK